ncbi:PepSY-associated TM helix domain-containing protein [Allosphingosinicella indica]|nr:PepSY-associated TM helix domain-containing protein [Allosphingosinicella indica]
MAEADPPVRVRAPKGRSLWWTVHAWAGLKLSLFMAWVMLTGTLATFSVEMDWLARPAMRVMPQDAPLASWGTLVEAARAAPAREGLKGAKVGTIYAPQHSWFSVEAIAATDDGRYRIYLDPYSGEARGTGAWTSFQRFFREMHRHLLMPAKWGIPLVCSLSLLLLASLVTGLVSYKKFWRGFLRKPRGGNARRLNGDMHRLAGLWSLWFVALIGLTGFWYLVESLGGDAPYAKAPNLADTTPAIMLDAARIDRLAATAQATYPALRILEMRLPDKAGKPIGFFGQADAMLVRDRVNGVWLDPANGRVIEVLRGESLTAHQRISEMADPLHFGTFGGMATKIIWFVFGVFLTGLCVTGAAIYSLRIANSGQPEERRAARRHGLVRRMFIGMGFWRWPAIAAVVASLMLIPGWLMK